MQHSNGRALLHGEIPDLIEFLQPGILGPRQCLLDPHDTAVLLALHRHVLLHLRELGLGRQVQVQNLDVRTGRVDRRLQRRVEIGAPENVMNKALTASRKQQ